LLTHEERKDAAANSTTLGFRLELAPLIATDVILVKLQLHNAAGQLLSDNLYWLGATSASYRQLTRLPAATLATSASWTRNGNTNRVHVQLQNNGAQASLENKLTLLNTSDGTRILPAYYSDNYVSLLPGESREIEIEYPVSVAKGAPQLNLRGWNLAPSVVPIAERK
jgi:hypothetical protein